MLRRAVNVPALALVAVLLAMLAAGCSPGAQPADPGAQPAETNGRSAVTGPGEPAAVEPSGKPPAAHQHADPSPTDALLLAGNAVLVVVVLGLVLRPPRVRARADGRWRLREADRRPPD